MVSLDAWVGVDRWAVDAMIRLACTAYGTNCYQRGRTVEDRGLKGLCVSEVMRYV